MNLNFGFQRLDGSSAYGGNKLKGHFFGQSSFASHAVASERNCVKISKSFPLNVAAPLGCGIQTGAGTILNSLAVAKGESVIVFGSGSVGLSSIMAAKLVGAAPIIAVDKEPKRLRLARRLGAHYAVNSSSADIEQRLRKIIGSGADYVLDTTSSTIVRRLAVKSLSAKGTLALFSGEAVTPGQRAISVIQGDSDPQRFIPFLIGQHRKGRFPFDRMLSFYHFHELNRAAEDVRKGRAIKAVLCMDNE